jgi:RNA polymerase sigma-70 factor (ECF subfamily)
VKVSLMGEAPTTRESLLVRIRVRNDGEAWSQFVEIYGPLVYDYGRRHGLQDADAADLTQEVLQAVAAAAEGFAYDPRKGSFRGWLFTVARTRRIDLGERLARQPRAGGDPTAAARVEAVAERVGDAEEAEWRRAFRQRLFDWAVERVRGEFEESTWQAFWRTAVGGSKPGKVAGELGMSVGAVYTAKSRVLSRLREQIERVRCDVDDS